MFFREYIPSKIDYSQKLVDQLFSLLSAKYFVRPHPLWTPKPLNVSRAEETTYKRPYLVNVTAIILVVLIYATSYLENRTRQQQSEQPGGQVISGIWA